MAPAPDDWPRLRKLLSTIKATANGATKSAVLTIQP